MLTDLHHSLPVLCCCSTHYACVRARVCQNECASAALTTALVCEWVVPSLVPAIRADAVTAAAPTSIALRCMALLVELCRCGSSLHRSHVCLMRAVAIATFEWRGA